MFLETEIKENFREIRYKKKLFLLASKNRKISLGNIFRIVCETSRMKSEENSANTVMLSKQCLKLAILHLHTYGR